MWRYPQAVGGAVVGAVGVMIVGEAWHVPEEDTRKPAPLSFAVYITPQQYGGPHDDAPHREPKGTVMLRYPTLVASTTSPATVFAVTAGEGRDVRTLCVPLITTKDARVVFGQEYWRTT